MLKEELDKELQRLKEFHEIDIKDLVDEKVRKQKEDNYNTSVK